MNAHSSHSRRYVLPAIQQVGGTGHWPRVAAILTFCAMAGCTAMGFVPWQQSLPGTGKMVAFAPMERQQTIDAPVEGRIVKWHVVEGSRVRKGDPVAEMADLDPTLPARLQMERTAVMDRIRAIGERERHLEERIEEMEQSIKNELAAADFRIQQSRDRIRAAEQTIDAATAKLTVATQNLDRHKSLFPKGLVSKRQLEVAEADQNTAAAELRRAEAQLNEARNVQRTVELERARTLNTGTAMVRDARASRESARSEAASARQSLQPVEVRLNRQSTQTVVAPVDGTIFRLTAQPGSAVVKNGEEIASIVPDVSAPVAELWVDGNDMPLIAAGRKVRLQFEGWPAIQFVGWPSVAVGTFGGVVRLVDSTDDGKGKFRLLVEPDPDDHPWPDSRYLRQGVRAKGWVLLNTVRLGFEVWRQFNGFPPVVAAAPSLAPGPQPAVKGSK
ncbi:MAG: HlyD family efflux transporter periplasmic adaptor subunit [Bryobacteraceae bacterium]